MTRIIWPFLLSVLLLGIFVTMLAWYRSEARVRAGGTSLQPVASLEAVALLNSPRRQEETGDGAKMTQLRLFTINRGKMDAFVDAWLKGVYPLRLKHGFKIEGSWVISERNQFLWILSYKGPGTFQAQDSAYYTSEARQKLDPDPVQYVANVERWFVTSVLPKP